LAVLNHESDPVLKRKSVIQTFKPDLYAEVKAPYEDLIAETLRDREFVETGRVPDISSFLLWSRGPDAEVFRCRDEDRIVFYSTGQMDECRGGRGRTHIKVAASDGRVSAPRFLPEVGDRSSTGFHGAMCK
jgi:hypothetical protein